MLPIVADFAAEMVDGTGREQLRGAIEAAAAPSTAKAQGGRVAERNPYHMFEYGPVAMPADAGTRIVANEESLHELIRCQAREGGGPAA